MKKQLLILATLTALTTIIAGCGTIIGGNASTKRTSGGDYGPATIAEGDITLSNDKFIALTITKGDLILNNFAIKYKLSTFGDLTVTNSDLNGVTQVGGNLVSNDNNFYQSCGILGNVTANDTYFAKDIEFAGESMIFTGSSKVVGNIISTSPAPVTVIVDHSKIKGNIGFANSQSTVIIRNRGYVFGQVINAKVIDQTGGDSYGGDDE